MPQLRKRFKKWKTCQMTLRKEARFYDREWRDERTEKCGAPLSSEAEMLTSMCDFCRFGGQGLLGATPQEDPEEVAARAQLKK